MDKQREDALVERARQLYRQHETERAQRSLWRRVVDALKRP